MNDGIRQASGSDVDSRELEKIQQQLSKAWVMRDFNTIDELLATDWSVTALNGNIRGYVSNSDPDKVSINGAVKQAKSEREAPRGSTMARFANYRRPFGACNVR